VKKRALILTIIIIALAQCSVLDYFRIFHLKPDLLLITTVIAALTMEFRWALFIAVLAGVLKDMFSIHALAFNAPMFAFLAFIIQELIKRVALENTAVRTVIVVIAVIFQDIIIRLISINSGSLIPAGIFLRVTILESLYTGLVSFFLFRQIR